MKRIVRYQEKDGLIWYEYGCLLAFTIADLVRDLKEVYNLDYTNYLFKPEQLN